MNEDLKPLTEFVKADRDSGRFFTIEYAPIEGFAAWLVSMYLGQGYTAPGVQVTGEDRWLATSANDLDAALTKMSVRLAHVRKRAGHA